MKLQQFENDLEALMAKYEGDKETSNNAEWSRHTDKLLKYMRQVSGWGPGAPYCAACIGGAIIATLEKYGEIAAIGRFREHYTAHCMTNLRRAKALGVLSNKPAPFAIMLFQKGDSEQGHAAMVKREVWKGSSVSTMEGNTGATGGREGDGFYSKTRVNGANGSLIVRGYIHLASLLAKLEVLDDVVPAIPKAEQPVVVAATMVPAYTYLDSANRLDLLKQALHLPGAKYDKADSLTYVPLAALKRLLA